MTLNIYIGTEDNQLIPQKVLMYSIRKFAKGKVNLIPCKQEVERVGGTNFGFVRFFVPSYNKFKGIAVYIDADQLVFDDINKLAETLDDKHTIALVNNAEGNFGKKPVGKINQTSVMVLNCEKLKDWMPDILFNNVVSNKAELLNGQIHYKNFMKLDWFDQSQIQSIDPAWNHFNIVKKDTKLTHFSHVRSQPWKNPSHPLCDFWHEWLTEAIRNRGVGRFELLLEILKGHVDKRFLRCLL